MGAGLNIDNLEAKADELMMAIYEYNNLLSNADAQGNRIDALEREVRDLNERIFTGVATHFGRNSNEYEMVGGIRKSEIDYGPKPGTTTFEPIEESPEQPDESLDHGEETNDKQTNDENDRKSDSGQQVGEAA